MREKKEDEIMAEYLLKGGKMLEKTCRQCGCPQFEFRGKTFCVVCAERGQERKGTAAPAEGQGETAADKAPAAPGGARAEFPPLDGSDAGAELASAIIGLCRRIRDEQDPDRCLVLMNAVKAGTEAITALRRSQD